MASTHRQIELELNKKLQTDSEIRTAHWKLANDAKNYAQRLARLEMTHGYATGKYVESIQIKQKRDAKGRFKRGWMLVTDDPKAHLLEYGTGFDPPWTNSPWGRYTPTPEFAIFSRTALRFGGTPDGD